MNILVVGAHPDDEAIGCGGIIKLLTNQGNTVEVLLLTSGELGRPGEDPEETGKLRVHEAFEASIKLGSKVLDFWGEPDGGLSCKDELVLRMSKVLTERKPDQIYVTSSEDDHPDHVAASDIVRMALKKSIFQPEVWMYEIWTPFKNPDKLVDISETIGSKMLAIRRHESQVNRIRFDEAALALARYRGELHNRPHGPFAEALKRLA